MITATQIKQIIGQQEASIDKIEPYLSEEDFAIFCDASATAITYWKIQLKRIHDKERGLTITNID